MNNHQVLDFFVDRQVLQRAEADDVQIERHKNGKTIMQEMLDSGFTDELGFYRAISEGVGTEFVDLRDREIAPEITKLIPGGLARLHRVLPIDFVDHTLRVAAADPLDPRTAEDLRFALGHDIEVVVAPIEQIDEGIKSFYGTETSSMDEVLRQLGESGVLLMV